MYLPRLSGEPTGTEEIDVNRPSAVRLAIRLSAPSVTECGFRLNSLAGDPEARACRERVMAEQEEVLRRIEQRLGRPLEVVWRFTRSANVISAWASPAELDLIRSVEGVAGVTQEMRHETAGGAVSR